METMLLAGKTEFDLDALGRLVPEDLESHVEDKVAGIRLLMVKTKTRFVAQIQPCSEEADKDTRDDLRSLMVDPPAEFVDALDQGSLRFLIVTYQPAELSALQQVIDAFVDAGMVQFDCSTEIRVLTD